MRLSVIKRGIVLLVIVALAVLAYGCGDDLPDGAAAKVGDTIITNEQLDTRVKEIQAQLGGQVPTKEEDPEKFAEFEKQVLDYLITLEVVTQKAGELEVSVGDEDVNAQIEQIKQMFGGDEAKFEEALKNQNMTLDALKKNLREQELIKKVIEVVTKDVKVSDEDIQAKYDENIESYKVDETRKTRHILFSPGKISEDPSQQASDAEWEAARQEAEKVRKQILDGGDFAELAKQNSDDPGSKPTGGDLGEVSRGTMVPEFDEATFALEKGKISEPVKTQFGYHLIEVQEISPPTTRSLEEVKDLIRQELEDEKKREAWEAWVKSSKDDLNVQVKEGLELTTTTTAGEATSTTVAAGDEAPTETTAATETTTVNQETTTSTAKE